MGNKYDVILAKSPLSFDVPRWLADFLEEYAERMLYERWEDIMFSIQQTDYDSPLVPFISLENCFDAMSPVMGTFFRWLWLPFCLQEDIILYRLIDQEIEELESLTKTVWRQDYVTLEDFDNLIETTFEDTFGFQRSELSALEGSDHFEDEQLEELAQRFKLFILSEGVPNLRTILYQKRFVHFEMLDGTRGSYLAPDILATHSYYLEFRTSTINDGTGGCYNWLTPQVEVW